MSARGGGGREREGEQGDLTKQHNPTACPAPHGSRGLGAGSSTVRVETRAERTEQQVRAGRSRRRLDTDGGKKRPRGRQAGATWMGTEAQ